MTAICCWTLEEELRTLLVIKSMSTTSKRSWRPLVLYAVLCVVEDEGVFTLSVSVERAGGPWGAAYIDVEFEKLLRMIFKEEWVDSFQRQRPDSYVSLLKNFRMKKESFEFGKNFAPEFEENIDHNWLEFYTLKSTALMQYVSSYRSPEEREWNEIALYVVSTLHIVYCIMYIALWYVCSVPMTSSLKWPNAFEQMTRHCSR